jgi:hypothetical protein
MDIDVDMSGDHPSCGRSPTPVQHAQAPQESVASHGPSQHTESTQGVINVHDFELNLFWDEEHDADLQRALQMDCEMQSSPTHPTVCAPSVIELDDAVNFDPGPSRDYPNNLPYGGVPDVGGSRECHDLAPHATEAVTFIGEYLYGPSKKTSEEQVQDPFAPGVVDLHRQTIEGQLRVWKENPRAGISPNLADELMARMAKRGPVEDAGVPRKGDIDKFIELDLKPIPSLSEGTLDQGDVVPESPEVEQQSTPEEPVITQVTATSPSRVSGSGSSRLSTTPGAFAIVESDMKASEGLGTNQGPPLFAAKPEPQKLAVPQRSTQRGIHISIVGSESTHQGLTAPSKHTGPTSRTTRLQSSKKFTESAIEDLERIMLKRLNLIPEALAPRNPPVWEVSGPSTCTCWMLCKAPFAASRSFAPQKTIPQC